jgi:hypothetical protein
MVGHFDNLTSRMHFYMVLSKRSFIWNNPRVSLAPFFQTMFVVFTRLFMVSNKPLVPGLIASVSFLLRLGFTCSTADSSLFIFRSEDAILLLLVYVDDIIVTSNKQALLSRLVSRLSSEFSMKDLGPLHYFLGIEVSSFLWWSFPFSTKICL